MAETEPLAAIDQVTKAFSSRRKSITLPEWNDLELWFSPLTSKDVDAVEDRMRARHGKDPSEWPASVRRITTIVLKAEDEAGKQAFALGHILAEKADYSTITKLYMFIHSVSGTQSVEDAKKKSRKTRGSGSS